MAGTVMADGKLAVTLRWCSKMDLHATDVRFRSPVLFCFLMRDLEDSGGTKLPPAAPASRS